MSLPSTGGTPSHTMGPHHVSPELEPPPSPRHAVEAAVEQLEVSAQDPLALAFDSRRDPRPASCSTLLFPVSCYMLQGLCGISCLTPCILKPALAP